jgi:hypothetical protein
MTAYVARHEQACDVLAAAICASPIFPDSPARENRIPKDIT